MSNLLTFEQSTSSGGSKLDFNHLNFKPTGENICLMFGWFASTNKLISKYAQFYKKKGFDVISYYPVPHISMSTIEKDVGVFIYQIDYLLKTFGTRSIMCHCFSIGGAVFAYFIKEIYKHSRFHYMIPLIKSVIFDSSPPYTKEGGENAMQYVLRISYLTMPFLLILPLYSKTYTALSEEYNVLFSPFNQWNYLFLYCKNDKIVLSSDVEKMMRDLKNHNKKVESHCWDKSFHTSHLKLYPEEYTKITNNFIDEMLKKSLKSAL
ncbi:hypothetical protein DLAC_09966 [Tieghemostelium lacteum]|uniref:Transmembrane protein n=1 Tax=Tieghemostelium lacteum TaxID=361077 RepID=A0A151Z5U3_TIELA|nr:hypothetical protein DLAC_09966 [Tieghemostelium lacteum]|eukprot:KYQ89307.1 hypothetical protein DLAC_09966 [Tieghemostelium lacteum]